VQTDHRHHLREFAYDRIDLTERQPLPGAFRQRKAAAVLDLPENTFPAAFHFIIVL
jgi:hypothetical protein